MAHYYSHPGRTGTLPHRHLSFIKFCIMNKLGFTISLLLLCAFTLTSCTDKKKKLKDQVTKECIEGGDKQFTDPKIRGYFHEYCECSGERTSEKISGSEWKEFDKMKKEGREAEMQAKLMPVIQPCLDELQKKISEASPTAPATVN